MPASARAKKRNQQSPIDSSISARALELIDDLDGLTKLISNYQTIMDTIEKAPVAFCIYDADDRLLVANAAYKNLYPELAQFDNGSDQEPVFYHELIRNSLKGTVSEDELDEAVMDRVLLHRAADGTAKIREYEPGNFQKIIKYRLVSGGSAGVALDISELKRRETELLHSNSAAEAARLRADEALQLENTRRQFTAGLSELSEWMQTCRSLEELFRVISHYLEKMFTGTCGDLFLYSPSRDVLDRACSWGNQKNPQNHIKVEDCWGLRRGRSYLFDRDSKGLLCDHALQRGEKQISIKSYNCIPILAHGEIIGLLSIEQSKSIAIEKEFAASQRGAAEQCAEQIGLAIANVRLRDELQEQSSRDSLTGLFNRRYFMKALRETLAFSKPQESCPALISLDVDRFKQINDKFGHEAGDAVLCRLSEVLKGGIPTNATVARLGGEEFSVLLPETSKDDALNLAESLRIKVGKMHIYAQGALLPAVTISCGVTSMDSDSERPSELLRRADKAMYQAKDSGRNKVCLG